MTQSSSLNGTSEVKEIKFRTYNVEFFTPSPFESKGSFNIEAVVVSKSSFP